MITPEATDDRVVVRVRDQVNRTLAGHGGGEYTSPPHERADALTLIALLLGRSPHANGDGTEPSRWICPVAGGLLRLGGDGVEGDRALAADGHRR